MFALVLALASGCGDDTEHSGPGGRTPDLSDAYAYLPESPYAADLVGCVDARAAPSSCTIATLPPISRRDSEPDVAAIMEHVVVSHDWMGERFEAILEEVPEDLRRVLGGVTAVVIDDDVRPSFYWSLTGAIYIDPRHLWLTPEEEATIGDEQDYRSGFGSDLSFILFSSYLDEGAPAFAGSAGPNRALEDRIPAVAALLFHEGAHANDFLPPVAVATLRSGETFLETIERLESSRLSRSLAASSPLRSELWEGLAEVLYRGEEATASQRGLTAEDVGRAFEPDGGSDPYAYSSQQEDFAMLFEETMMKYHFDFDRRVGFATASGDEVTSCADYEIGWGSLNRIAAAPVAPRARRVAELVLGDPLDDFFSALPGTSLLTPGQNLCIEASSPPASALRWM
ncbi:MAG: hypothetical protein P8R42_09935 [Candidatus Binatia bacterium]|nr:hypothetical protein [Candidatus Binatia bacterium]